MIDVIIFLVLNFIGVFASLIMIEVKVLPEPDKGTSGWGGIAFIFDIMALIIWLSLSVIASTGNVGFTSTYAVVVAGVLTTGSQTVVFDLMWPVGLIYSLVSIPYMFLLFYLMPETWKTKRNE